MTSIRRDRTVDRPQGGDTPNGAWIRNRPELDSRNGYDLQDIDRLHSRQYWWNAYKLGYLMLLEEKEYDAEPKPAQKDTLNVVSQALWKAFRDPTFKVKREFPGRTREYTFFGYNLVQFENTSPLDGRIRINRISVTVAEYLRFLQFDRDFMEERLHIHPQMSPVSDLPPYPLQKLNRRSRKGTESNVQTLFNPTPTQQQSLDWSSWKEVQS